MDQAAGEADAAGLVTLSAKDRGIADLEGIGQLTRLEVLDLYGNEIRDLSPLSGLARLRYLDLGSNRVEEVTALGSLRNLRVLLLAGNAVTEVSALAGLDSLQSVDLTGNPLGEAAQARVEALRERGVSVEFSAPEPGDSVDGSPPAGPFPAGRPLLFSSNRRLEGDYIGALEVHSLDVETGEVVNLSSALTGLPKSDGSFPDSLEALYFTRRGEQPALSPDGTRVAFSSIRDGDLEIYVMDADGGNPVNLTRDDAYDSGPAWSPDGQRIAFERSSGGRGGPQIYVMNADGSGVEWLTEDPEAWGHRPAWSPDGSAIACDCGYASDHGVYILDLAAGGMQRISPEGQYAGEPSWSPDGTRIAYIALDDDDYDVSHLWVMAADGTGARQLTFNQAWEDSPTWSPDGTRIALARLVDVETRYDIYTVDLASGAEERLTDDPYDDMYPNWTPF